MLWIPRDSFDWLGGYINIATLKELYIPRSPVQSRLASQRTVISLGTTRLTVELLLQQWLEESRIQFEAGKCAAGAELASKAWRLATEEIARSYHKHMLAKIQSCWDRLPDRNMARAPLDRLVCATEDIKTDKSYIVSGQTIFEIYTQAWDLFVAGDPDARSSEMPAEIPCWLTTRKHLPPKDGWSSFVFGHLFNRPSAPTWNGLEFLNMYRRFKGFWSEVQSYTGAFDERFRLLIGRYILVCFNSDRTKEVGAYHLPGCWYDDLPIFFRIHYYAPYFSPPETSYQFPWLWVPNRQERQPSLPVEIASTIMTSREFQDNYDVLEELWLRIRNEKSIQCGGERHNRSQLCIDALDRLMIYAGPRWEYGHIFPYFLPWECPDPLNCSASEYDDPFSLPTRAHSHRDKPCAPTLFFPTRVNITALVDAIESLCTDPDVVSRIIWIRSVLEHNGEQFSIVSHLQSKHLAAMSVTQTSSELRIFLSQTEPPQWVV